MAEIHIQAKKPPIWPWAVGLVVLALVLWASYALLGIGRAEDPLAGVSDPTVAARATQSAPATGAAAAPAEVRSYLDSCARPEPGAMSLDHEYTSNCVRQLVQGLEAVVRDRNLALADAQPQLQQARQHADQLAASGPQEAQHSSMARDAFQAVARAMNSIQDAHYPQLDAQVTQLESTAGTIQPGTGLLEQRENVQRFFQQAGQALNAMATASPGAA